jgi:hypothetical protein
MLKSLRNAPGFIDAPDQQFPLMAARCAGDHEVAVDTSRRIMVSPSLGMTAIDWLFGSIRHAAVSCAA